MQRIQAEGTASTAAKTARPYEADATIAGTLGEPREGEAPAIPERVGRFVVLEQLGAGGMGVVYAAYDPDLDRRVALKFLRSDGASARTRTRLLREAKALARLSHPHVIQVYDVGAVGGRVYVAMEFIDGLSLRAWLGARTRPAPEILDAFAAAGRGLLAAHQAGLVHRDFKPDNVMVARDEGRVVVLDFGIAHAIEAPSESDSTQQGDPVPDTSGLVGTPRYMAPEQFSGQPSDARTDQFSFCVALWEALYGQHPFAPEGATAMILAARVLDGTLQPPRAQRSIPRPVHRALRRGLERDPDARFPDLDGLLDSIAQDVRARRRMIAMGGVVAASLATAAWAGTQTPSGLCTDGADRIGDDWNPERGETLRAAFDATGAPYAADSFVRVAARLDAYANAWSTVHDEACAATHLEHTQSATLLDARMQCLDARRVALRTRVEVLTDTTRETLPKAVSTAADLPPLEPCSDLAQLASPTAPLPVGASGTAATIREAIEAADAARSAGQFDRASVQAHVALDAAEVLDYPPLLAAAQLAVARALGEASDYDDALRRGEQAFHGALASRDDALALQAATHLLSLIGDRQRRPEDALVWGRLADSLLARLDTPSEDAAELASVRGVVLWRAERLEAARASLDDALRHAVDAGADELELASIRTTQGAVLYSAGELEAARSTLESAVRAFEAALGPEHPRICDALNNLGAVAFARGDFDEALEAFERVAKVRAAAHGADHPTVAAASNNLAVGYAQRGERRMARDTHGRVLQIYEATLGADHPETAKTHANLGWVLHSLDDNAGAQNAFERAIEIQTARELDTSNAYEGLGEALIAQGEADAGLAALQRAVDQRLRSLPAEHPDLAEALMRLGTALVALDRPEDALPLLDRARAIRRVALPPGHPDHGFTLTYLVRAYADLGRIGPGQETANAFDALPASAQGPLDRARRVRFDRARLDQDRARARATMQALREDIPPEDRLRAELDAWLEDHG
ncbi:MAG: serine/threonine-protein kinase [Myxococcota bacterium]